MLSFENQWYLQAIKEIIEEPNMNSNTKSEQKGPYCCVVTLSHSADPQQCNYGMKYTINHHMGLISFPNHLKDILSHLGKL